MKPFRPLPALPLLFLALLVLAPLPVSAPARAQKTTPQQNNGPETTLRALIAAYDAAVAKADQDALGKILADDFTIIPIDQTVIDSPAALKTWYAHNRTGSYALIQSVILTPEKEAKIDLLGPDHAHLSGITRETYAMTTGDTITFTAPWTAVAGRQKDGQWRLLSHQSGVNVLDNPLLQATKSTTLTYAAGGLAWGVFIGIVVGLMVGRRRRAGPPTS